MLDKIQINRRNRDMTTKQQINGIFNYVDIIKQNPPIQYFTIPQLLPIGLITVSGKPKIGKTWLILKLAIDTSQGNQVFGKYPCEPKRVFFCSLNNVRVSSFKDRCLDLGLYMHASVGKHWRLSNCKDGSGLEVQFQKILTLKQIKKTIKQDKTEILIVDNANSLLNNNMLMPELNNLAWEHGVSILLTTNKTMRSAALYQASCVSEVDWTISSIGTESLQIARHGGEDETPISVAIGFSEHYELSSHGLGRKPVTIEAKHNELNK